ncbi:MAG: hypothetical protein JWP14_1738 [Frankiales bacterium]|nr:hypothetical protein [Frankiales bacterium]
MRKSTKITAGLGGVALTLATAGVAYAYWTTTGSGAGSATAAAANGTLALHAADVPGITPGSSYSVPIMADNAGTTNLVVNSVSTVISSTLPACQTLITAGTSGLSFANVTTSGVTVVHNTTNTVIGTGSLVWTDSTSVDQSACKSAPIVLTFSG